MLNANDFRSLKFYKRLIYTGDKQNFWLFYALHMESSARLHSLATVQTVNLAAIDNKIEAIDDDLR
jgi:hypothetical protein